MCWEVFLEVQQNNITPKRYISQPLTAVLKQKKKVIQLKQNPLSKCESVIYISAYLKNEGEKI